MEQRSSSKLGGLLGVITFFILIAAAFADDPEASWTLGNSPLVPALWLALLGIAEMADALIAMWNGSKGTGHMIDIAGAKGLRVYVHLIDEET